MMDNIKVKFFKLLMYLFALFWSIVQLYPVLFIFMSSFKDNSSIINNIFAPPSLFDLRIENWLTVFLGEYQDIKISRYLLNSTIVSILSIVFVICASLPCGYALTKFRGKISSLLSDFFLFLVAIPFQAVVIPLYFTISWLSLLNTYLGLALPYAAFSIPFSTLIAKAFFKSFPKELEEAAKIDGAGDLMIFVKVVLPLSRNLIAILAIINFPGFWNELMFATISITSNDMRTLPIGILAFRGRPEMEPRWDLMFAAMGISTLPLIVFYLLFQSQIIRGMMVGAVRG